MCNLRQEAGPAEEQAVPGMEPVSEAEAARERRVGEIVTFSLLLNGLKSR